MKTWLSFVVIGLVAACGGQVVVGASDADGASSPRDGGTVPVGDGSVSHDGGGTPGVCNGLDEASCGATDGCLSNYLSMCDCDCPTPFQKGCAQCAASCFTYARCSPAGGDVCGGIAGLHCPLQAQDCALETSGPDALGKCVPAGSRRCGNAVCALDEYCQARVGGATLGNKSYACAKSPTTCAGQPCSCLVAGQSACQCDSANTATGMQTVTCQVP